MFFNVPCSDDELDCCYGVRDYQKYQSLRRESKMAIFGRAVSYMIMNTITLKQLA